MKRREFITGLGRAVVACSSLNRSAFAQTPARIYRLGTITGNQPIGLNSPAGKILLSALAEHGYVPGQNLAVDARGAGGQLSKIPQILQELKASGVDAIMVVGYPTALAAKAAGIPTVIAYGAGDPVATGLVDSLGRPGGSITGISDVATTLSTKRLSLLKELLPKLQRVAMLWNAEDLGMTLRYKAAADAAQALGVMVQPLGVREPDDFNGVFEAMDHERPDAILMVSDALTVLNRKRVFDYASAKRLPAIYEYDVMVRDGGLMSYGPDLTESLQRAAVMVDRVFKGAKPSDIPFEQPTRYLFVINLQTARTIGLDIPATVLALADEVIE